MNNLTKALLGSLLLLAAAAIHASAANACGVARLHTAKAVATGDTRIENNINHGVDGERQ